MYGLLWLYQFFYGEQYRGLELTGDVVDNLVFRKILIKAVDGVKGGSSVSDAFLKHEEIPGIFVQMVKIGEETGQLGNILKTLANFYRREVTNAIDTIVGLTVAWNCVRAWLAQLS